MVSLSILEAFSKLGFWFKVKAEPYILQPASILEYVEDLKYGANAEIESKDIFEMLPIKNPALTRPGFYQLSCSVLRHALSA
jgi:hypothetical protein